MQKCLLPLYLCTLFLLGLGYMGIMPPFEGFDETAHYSSIRQIADSGTLPLFGKSFLDKEVTTYGGPLPYSSGEPPFDGGLSYAKFFSDKTLVKEYLAQRSAPARTRFEPSDQKNWQAQHPPMYYGLMSLFELTVEQLPLTTRMLVIREVSYVLALVGMFLGFLAARNPSLRLRDDPAVIGFFMYPIMLPMFFPEFTRIGNDSLCLFLTGAISFLLSKYLKNEVDSRLAILTGIALGFGLLTKAFFLPISAALLVFLVLRLVLCKNGGSANAVKARNVGLVFLSAGLIGGGWYVYKFLSFGSFVGGIDYIALDQKGGLIAHLANGLPLYDVVRALVVTFVTYVWGGTWSLTRLSPIFLTPLLALVTVSFAFAIWMNRRKSISDASWLPVIIFAMFGFGFLHHAMVGVALSGNGQTPGWYLHILAPWVAPFLGIGLIELFRKSPTRPLAVGAFAYAALFQVMAIWSQMTLFAGCSTKGADKSYVFADQLFCLDRLDLVWNHLSVLGWPTLAAIGFGGGLTCMLFLIVQWRKATKPFSMPIVSVS